MNGELSNRFSIFVFLNVQEQNNIALEKNRKSQAKTQDKDHQGNQYFQYGG